MNRRKFLIGGGLVGVIGLFGFSNFSSVVTGSTRPEESPETVPAALQCTPQEKREVADRLLGHSYTNGAEDVQRYWKGYDEGEVAWGDAGSYALRVNKQSFDYGETATITLTKWSLSKNNTGARGSYNFELYTEAGWQEVRVTEGPMDIPSHEVGQPPGGGFEWEFPLTEDGIAGQGYEVCPDLQSGRYRFTYWGLEDGAVAVAFDLQREK